GRGLAATGFRNLGISSLTSTGDATLARISPDGRYVVYVSNQRGRKSLWVRQIATASAVQVVAARSEPIEDVAFVSDGNFLDYASGSLGSVNSKIYQIPALGAPQDCREFSAATRRLALKTQVLQKEQRSRCYCVNSLHAPAPKNLSWRPVFLLATETAGTLPASQNRAHWPLSLLFRNPVRLLQLAHHWSGAPSLFARNRTWRLAERALFPSASSP